MADRRNPDPMESKGELGAGRVALRIGGAGLVVAALSFAPLSSFPSSLGTSSFGTPAGAVGLTAAADATPVVTAADDVAALLPEDLWIAAEGRGLGAIASSWSGSRLHQRISASAAWKKAAKTPQYAQFLAGLAFVELVSGMKPVDLAGALLGEQIVAGLLPDGDQPGVVAVIRVIDADTAAHLFGVARSLALMNKEAPPKSVSHRGVDAIGLNDKLWFAASDRQLLLASSERLLQKLIDRALAPVDQRKLAPLLATLRSRSRGNESGSELLRVAADVKKLATTRPDGRLAPAKSDNSFAAMLFGDVVELACRADVLGASLRMDSGASGDALALTVDVPGDPAQLPEHFRSFGHKNAQQPLPLLAPPGTMLTWSVRRDYAQFWADHGELCDPSTEKEFADLKTNLGLFFGGKSLPDDVLPQLDEELLFVLSRQTFAGIPKPPEVKYPAGAFVYRARPGVDVAKLGQIFAIGTHSLVALVNVDRAMKNQTPLLPFVETFEGSTIWGGRCLTDDDRPADPGRFNFSPAATWVGEWIILSSTDELARDLLRDLKQPITASAAPGRTGLTPGGFTAWLRVDAPALRALARDDRDALVSNAVLNEGKSQTEAEDEIDLAIELLGELSHATFTQKLEKDGMKLAVDVTLKPFVAPAAPATTPAGSGAPR